MTPDRLAAHAHYDESGEFPAPYDQPVRRTEGMVGETDERDPADIAKTVAAAAGSASATRDEVRV